MKKKLLTIFMIGVLSFSLLAGCAPVDREAQAVSYTHLTLTTMAVV